MAELLDEFLASLEEFGERELAVEDALVILVDRDHMADFCIISM